MEGEMSQDSQQRLVRVGLTGMFFSEVGRYGVCPTQAIMVAAGVALGAHALTWLLPDTLCECRRGLCDVAN